MSTKVLLLLISAIANQGYQHIRNEVYSLPGEVQAELLPPWEVYAGYTDNYQELEF